MADEAKAVPSPPSEIDDSGDLRGYHFRQLIGKPATLIIGAILVAAAAIAGAVLAGPAIGAAGAAGAVLLVLLVVFFIAASKSEEAFFDLYATKRSLERTASGKLSKATPLLRKGDERKAQQIMRGQLAEDVSGTLALYTYTDVYHDKNGRHENNYNFTVAITKIPAVAQLAPEIICNRKFGFRAFEKVEDAFRGNERVKLESIDLDDRFEIFVDEKQNPNWIRQLFSPSFIVWLCEETPKNFAFELVDGVLVCNIKGHKKNAAELDAMCEAMAGVARRLRDEAAEETGLTGRPAPA